MKVHNRSPTEKALHKNEQCRHTFEITHKRCAPCSGYDTNCERYEKTTNGMYPAFAIWENVPGAFSSNGGEDFRTVLEKLAHAAQPDVSIPRPAGGGGDGARPEQSSETAGLWHGGCSTLNVGECPSVESVSQLSQILEVNVPQRYFLSARACQGILTRASRRGKALPDLLKTALLDMIEWWQGRQPTP